MVIKIYLYQGCFEVKNQMLNYNVIRRPAQVTKKEVINQNLFMYQQLVKENKIL